MCRNIRTLFNFEPPASEDEVRASALQFVRKLSGFAHPSNANEAAFARARGREHNAFKIGLARRAIVRALTQAAAGTPQSQSNKKIR